MESITVRPAKKSDADDILKLLCNIARLHYESRGDIFLPVGSKYSKEQVENIISNEKTPVLVADLNGRVIGYVFCVLREIKGSGILCARRYLYIDDLCVDKNERGNGIGKMLMEAAEKLARSLSCSSIELNVWNISGGAKKFYENLGMSEQRAIMEKKL